MHKYFIFTCMGRNKKRKRPRSFWDKFWRDEHGNDIIWQRPNKLLLLWAICAFITLLLRGGLLEDILSWIGTISIVLWAIFEVAWGVNYFRRSVGFMVLLITAFAHL